MEFFILIIIFILLTYVIYNYETESFTACSILEFNCNAIVCTNGQFKSQVLGNMTNCKCCNIFTTDSSANNIILSYTFDFQTLDISNSKIMNLAVPRLSADKLITTYPYDATFTNQNMFTSDCLIGTNGIKISNNLSSAYIILPSVTLSLNIFSLSIWINYKLLGFNISSCLLNLSNILKINIFDSYFELSLSNSFGSIKNNIYDVSTYANKWMHFVWVSDGKNWYIYVNNKKIILNNNLGIASNSFYKQNTLCADNDGTKNFYGRIDDFKFYNSILSDQDVLKLYNQASDSINMPIPLPTINCSNNYQIIYDCIIYKPNNINNVNNEGFSSLLPIVTPCVLSFSPPPRSLSTPQFTWPPTTQKYVCIGLSEYPYEIIGCRYYCYLDNSNKLYFVSPTKTILKESIIENDSIKNVQIICDGLQIIYFFNNQVVMQYDRIITDPLYLVGTLDTGNKMFSNVSFSSYAITYSSSIDLNATYKSLNLDRSLLYFFTFTADSYDSSGTYVKNLKNNNIKFTINGNIKYTKEDNIGALFLSNSIPNSLNSGTNAQYLSFLSSTSTPYQYINSNIGTTFSFWFKGYYPSMSQRIFSFGTNSNSDSNTITVSITYFSSIKDYTYSNLTFSLYDNNGNIKSNISVLTPTFNLNWVHIVWTLDINTGWNIYLNGLNVMTVQASLASYPTITTRGNLFIGKNPNNNNQYLNGWITDFRVYNRALTTDEISTIYVKHTLYKLIKEVYLKFNFDKYSIDLFNSKFISNLYDNIDTINNDISSIAILKLDLSSNTVTNLINNSLIPTTGNVTFANYFKFNYLNFRLNQDFIQILPFTIIPDAFSVSFWVYCTNTQNSRIFDFDNSIYISLSNNNNGTCDLIFTCKSGVNIMNITQTGVLKQNQLVHFVWTINFDKTWTIYKNGVSIFNNYGNYPDIILRKLNYIGKSSNSPDYFSGYVGDFRIYYRLLTSTDASTLYSLTNLSTLNSDPTLVIYYNFNKLSYGVLNTCLINSGVNDYSYSYNIKNLGVNDITLYYKYKNIITNNIDARLYSNRIIVTNDLDATSISNYIGTQTTSIVEQQTTQVIFTGNNYFQIAQIAIYGQNNNYITPSSISAPSFYPGGLGYTAETMFDGRMSTQAWPRIYHSAGNNNVDIIIKIPPTIIKEIKIYNRADCCKDRIASFRLILKNSKDVEIYSTMCSSDDIQTISPPQIIVNPSPVNPSPVISNNFSPSSIKENGCILWLDANDPLNNGTQPSPGAAVLIWNDKSGLGNNATSNTNITYNKTGLNGLPAFTFNNREWFTGRTTNNTNKMTIFAVCSMNSNAKANARIIGFSQGAGQNDSNDGRFMGFQRKSGTGFRGIRNNDYAANNPPSYDTPYLFETWYDGTNNNNLVHQGESTEIKPVGSTGNFDIKYYTIGNNTNIGDTNGPFSGFISEIIVYSSVLSNEQMQFIEGYLSSKWGLQNNLKLNHPYKIKLLINPLDSDLYLTTYYKFESGDIVNNKILDYITNTGFNSLSVSIDTNKFYKGTGSLLYLLNGYVSFPSYTISTTNALLGFSWSIWTNSSGSSPFTIQMNTNSSVGSQGITVMYTNNSGSIKINMGGLNYTTTDFPTNISNLYDGKWHHNVFTYIPATGTINLYFDGNLIYSKYGTAIISNYPVILSNNTITFYPGNIDDFRFYSRALLTSEVTSLYTNIPVANTSTSPGIIGINSLTFDGTSKTIIPIPSITLPNNFDGYTISFWGKFNSDGNTYSIFELGNGGNNDNIMMAIQSDICIWVFNGGNGDGSYGASNSNLINNVWYHIVWTINYTNRSWSIYINNILKQQWNNRFYPTQNKIINTNNFGKSSWGWQPMKGNIDDFRIYNKVLSSDEITNLYTLQNLSVLNNDSKLIFSKNLAVPMAGKINSNALLLNSNINDYLLVSPFQITNNGISISLWFKSFNTPNFSRIMDFGNGPNKDNIIITINNSLLELTVNTLNKSFTYNNFYNINLNNSIWTHLVWSINPDGSWVIFINGLNVGQQNSTLIYPSTIMRNNNYIGKGSLLTDSNFNGQVDDFRFYNRILSQNEIQNIYNINNLSSIDSSNLLIYYDFKNLANGVIPLQNKIDGIILGDSASQYTMPQKVGNNSFLTFNSLNKQFMSVNSYLSNSNNYSFSFWFKTASPASAPLFDFGNGINNSNISVNIVDNQNISFTVNNSSKPVGFTSTITLNFGIINTNNWIHLGWVLNNSNNSWLIYKNSVLITTLNNNTTLINTLKLMYPESITRNSNFIGKNNQNNSYFSGCIYKFRMFNRFLSANEIFALYKQEIIDTNLNIVPILPYPSIALSPSSNKILNFTDVNSFRNGTYAIYGSSNSINTNQPYNLFNNSSTGGWTSAYVSINSYTQNPYLNGIYRGGGTPTTNYSLTISNGITISGEWIRLELPNSIVLTSYSFVPNNSYLYRSPGEWYLLATNTSTVTQSTVWTVIDYRLDIFNNISPNYNISYPNGYTAYSKFALIILKLREVNKPDATCASFQQFLLYGSTPPTVVPNTIPNPLLDNDNALTIYYNFDPSLYISKSISFTNSILYGIVNNKLPMVQANTINSSITQQLKLVNLNSNMTAYHYLKLPVFTVSNRLVISFWYKFFTNNSSSTNYRILEFSDNSGDNKIYINHSSKIWSLIIQNTPSPPQNQIDLNNYSDWFCLVWVIYPSTNYIYINNILLGVFNNGISNILLSKNYIGNYSSNISTVSATSYMSGSMSEIKIINRDLSLNERLSLYYATKVKLNSPNINYIETADIIKLNNDPDLYLYYTFTGTLDSNNNVSSISGSLLNKIVGNPNLYITGSNYINYDSMMGFYFDYNNKLNTLKTDMIEIINSDITICFWYKCYNVNDNYDLFNFNNDTDTYKLKISMTGTWLTINIDGNRSPNNFTTINITNNIWNFFTFIINRSGKLEIYINSTLEYFVDFTFPEIGYKYISSFGPAMGCLGDFRFYNRKLYQNEIFGVYNFKAQNLQTKLLLNYDFNVEDVNNYNLVNLVTQTADAIVSKNNMIVTHTMKIGTGCIYFDNSTYVTLPPTKLFETGFSIGFWFEQVTSKNATILEMSNYLPNMILSNANNVILSIVTRSTTIVCSIVCSGILAYTCTHTCDINLQNYVWKYITWTVSYNGISYIYVGNDLISKINFNFYPNETTLTNCYLGTSVFNSNNFINGYIDNFKFYSGQISSNDISNNFIVNIPTINNLNNDKYLLVYYSFKSEFIITDISNNQVIYNIGANNYDSIITPPSSIISVNPIIGKSNIIFSSNLGSYMQFAQITNTNYGLSFSVWFKSNNRTNNWNRIFELSNGMYIDYIICAISNNTLALQVDSTTVSNFSLINVNDNTWHNLIWILYPNNMWMVYLDGFSILPPNTNPYPPVKTRTSNFIASTIVSPRTPSSFNGEIDDFRIYNRILTYEEVLVLIQPKLITDSLTNISIKSSAPTLFIPQKAVELTPYMALVGITNSITGFYARYTASKCDVNNIWKDISPNGNDLLFYNSRVPNNKLGFYGLTSIESNNSNGSLTNFSVIRGTTQSNLTLTLSRLDEYTLFHVARYTGGTRGRIFNGNTNNWLSGFWNGRTGCAHHDSWLTSQTDYYSNNWIISTDWGSSITNTSEYRSNGVSQSFTCGPNGQKTGGNNGGIQYLPPLGINSGEPSDFDIADIIIFNKVLTSSQINIIELYLSTIYGIKIPDRGPNCPTDKSNCACPDVSC